MQLHGSSRPPSVSRHTQHTALSVSLSSCLWDREATNFDDDDDDSDDEGLPLPGWGFLFLVKLFVSAGGVEQSRR